MSQDITSVDNVFGITRELPKNYVGRDSVDGKLNEDLSRGKHIVVYGSSKQGKTCLRKHCIDSEEQITVQCSNKWELKDIHSTILKQAGYEITLSEKKTVSGTQKIKARLSAGVPHFGASSSVEGEKSESTETETKELELDPTDVNDVIRALKEIGFDKYIVLEDFHYLPENTQKDFAVALKAFHEASPFCFIIVGVWLEQNRLIVHNGDLTGRVIAVNADEWKHNQLRRVIEKGENILNVKYDLDFKDELINNCFDSVYIVQEACRNVALEEDVSETQPELERLASDTDAKDIINQVVDEQSARYRAFIRQFSDGFQATELEMYKWILYPILEADTDDLDDGILYADLREKIQSEHPRGDDLNPGNLTQALKSTASLQVDKDIKPIIMDYDQTNRRLSIVDRGFLIWLDNTERTELFEQAGLNEVI
ncbi:hypothetical protein [Haloarcula sp. CBA1127]|uniref:hypothetical protein n=1 Tax=Haloarcula sp. CBA1127 TaxID=1765055 RepID=UPI00073EF431|nr:hypothetical protein [Haloarcula sp. CBA1127]